MLTFIGRTVKSLFLHGLLTLFPIAATIVIVHLCYSMIARWIAPLNAIVPPLLAHKANAMAERLSSAYTR